MASSLVVVAEAFGWLRTTPWRWRHVVMTYLPALPEDDFALLVRLLEAVQAAGGGFFVEQARVGLPPEHEARLVAALGVPAVDVSRRGAERIRLSS